MPTAQEILELVAFGREQHGVEFKGPGSREDKSFLCLVIRAMLAMANRRDGGLVLIGITDTPAGLSIVGLADEQLATWKHDHLADSVAAYTDPSLRFDSDPVTVNDRSLVAIAVHEFDTVPGICCRSYQDSKGVLILRDGALYVRSRRKPESREVATYEDMLELMDLATEKSTRRFIAPRECRWLTVPR